MAVVRDPFLLQYFALHVPERPDRSDLIQDRVGKLNRRGLMTENSHVAVTSRVISTMISKISLIVVLLSPKSSAPEIATHVYEVKPGGEMASGGIWWVMFWEGKL